ncbi:MAG: hypothetical protein CVV49_00145 [Spirochaetae bacterium HGW-Spirochaetae-5]|nr:MAG: hypothetical protein CVV49_00145 [Spirochaetae bacterium HGW-Spirochaetae-5]
MSDRSQAKKATNYLDYEVINFFDLHYKKEFYIEFNNEFVGLAPRRGNVAHDSRVSGRVWKIEKMLEAKTNIDTENSMSNLIHVVLTYPDTFESWEQFGKDSKYFFDALRRDSYIEMTDYIVTLEATKKGVAHAHILITLKNPVKFVMRRRYNKYTKKTKPFAEIADPELKDRINSKWKHITSVEACYSTRASYYIFKYVAKGFNGVKAIYQKAKAGAALTDEELKKIIGLYSLIKHNKKAFRASRGYSSGRTRGVVGEVQTSPVDCPSGYDGFCGDCRDRCFFSLVIEEAHLLKHKRELTHFWSYEAVKTFRFPELDDSDVVKSFRVLSDGVKNQLFRGNQYNGADIQDVELYKKPEDKK